jgi:Initiator tRNA phosphoribosyl transferase.
MSIHFDSNNFLKKTIGCFHQQQQKKNSENNEGDEQICDPRLIWPVVANERCGSWYAYPHATALSAHFKSTDGHTNIHNFSLKRLNLPFLHTVSIASNNNGAVLIVDSSKYKKQPDSFSATLPIWCAVMNGLISYYQHSTKVGDDDYHGGQETLNATINLWKGREVYFDSQHAGELYTPSFISQERHDHMKSIISERIQSALSANVILDPTSFLQAAPLKPMRCFWIGHESDKNSQELYCCVNELVSEIIQAQASYSCIVCINCSDSKRGKTDSDYVSGAGDDEESWAMGLTASLFWENLNDLIFKIKSEEEMQQAIKRIVAKAKGQNEEWFREREYQPSNCPSHLEMKPCFTSYFDKIGESSLYIGSRRAGRPPECWEYFDAIVNVTTMEYDEISNANGHLPEGKLYLQLPVKEGKRDRVELENWMAVAMLFVGINLVKNKRILIHCAQGMDRSVAVAISSLCIYFNFHGQGINLHEWCYEKLSYQSFGDYMLEEGINIQELPTSHNRDEEVNFPFYLKSQMPLSFVVLCKGKEGRDLFLRYIKYISRDLRCDVDKPEGKFDRFDEFFATKETLRMALIKIQQYRPKACPTRSTMQKLNRFFMSGVYEK